MSNKKYQIKISLLFCIASDVYHGVAAWQLKAWKKDKKDQVNVSWGSIFYQGKSRVRRVWKPGFVFFKQCSISVTQISENNPLSVFQKKLSGSGTLLCWFYRGKDSVSWCRRSRVSFWLFGIVLPVSHMFYDKIIQGLQ